jgi:uncharacterized membrane protein
MRGGAALRSHLASIAKAVSWRVTAGIDTFIVSYLVTGSIKGATSIAALELMTKIGLFWAHERAWLRLERRDWSRLPLLLRPFARRPAPGLGSGPERPAAPPARRFTVRRPYARGASSAPRTSLSRSSSAETASTSSPGGSSPWLSDQKAKAHSLQNAPVTVVAGVAASASAAMDDRRNAASRIES